MMFGWTPQACLEMKASLFFGCLIHGTVVKNRNKFRDYYELCRIAAYPVYSKDSQDELLNYYWDSSLSPFEREDANEFREKMEEESKKRFVSNAEVFGFFKSANRRALDGR